MTDRGVIGFRRVELASKPLTTFLVQASAYFELLTPALGKLPEHFEGTCIYAIRRLTGFWRIDAGEAHVLRSTGFSDAQGVSIGYGARWRECSLLLQVSQRGQVPLQLSEP